MIHWADYLIFVVFLALSVAIGLYHALTGGRQRTNEEFISGNHQLRLIPTAISLVTSYMSALTIISSSAEVYSYGLVAWPGYSFSSLITCTIVSFVVIPWLHRLQLVSVYQYFNRRYGHPAIQMFTSMLGITAAILYTATATLAPAIAMETATGFPVVAAIPTFAVVTTLYTAMGGIRAVVWTDVFQGVVMLAGILTILIKAFLSCGGPVEAFHQLVAENRTYISLSANPTVRHTPWCFLFGLTVSGIGFIGLQQSSVQRFSSLPSVAAARRVPYLWWIGTVTFASSSYLIAIALFAYYAIKRCDPLLSGRVDSNNQLLPLFVIEIFGRIPGFSGLFMATLCSATLSTVSSTLSGAAANAWGDIIKPRFPNIPESRGATISKLLVVFFGTISIGLAFLVRSMKGTILQVTIMVTTSVNAPTLGLFALGGFKCFRWIKWQGALTGAIIALLINMWIVYGAVFAIENDQSLPPLPIDGCSPSLNVTFLQPTYKPVTGLSHIYGISYVWYTSVGCYSTITFAVISSLLYRLLLPKRFFMSAFCPRDEVFITLTNLCGTQEKNSDEVNGVLTQMTEEKTERVTSV